MLLHSTQFAILLILAETTFASINTTIQDVSNKLDVEAINKKLAAVVETRRAVRDRSTSSSSGEKKSSGKKSGSSLSFSSQSDTEEKEVEKNKRYYPKSSLERKGWRKWHRKCPRCPEMQMKWRDPQINWICGAYQRARRSFKSVCMMHYRNCQDGTMFTKIADHRCPNDSSKDSQPHGDHFFYEYKVILEDESIKSKSSMSLDSEETGDSAEDIFNM